MRRLSYVLSACALLAGCAATPPPAPEPLPVPSAPALPLAEPVCPACLDRSDEIARLRQDLANREAELRDLRSSQREQVRAVQESSREVTRAKARVRRLATQADAASYLAEVEVALQSARPAATASPLLGLAAAFLTAAQAPFAQGDYATAMDRAAQAEQLVTAAAAGTPTASRTRVAGEVLLQAGIPLKSRGDAPLRRAPERRAAVVATLARDTALTAHAYKGDWMRVETEDGRFGWLPQAELAAR